MKPKAERMFIGIAAVVTSRKVEIGKRTSITRWFTSGHVSVMDTL